MAQNTTVITAEEKSKLLWGAWIIAAFATVLVEIPALLLAPVFPLGLAYMLMPKQTVSHTLVCTVGWMMYFSLTLTAALTKRRAMYFIIYGVLCLLLALNVAGCHRIMKQL